MKKLFAFSQLLNEKVDFNCSNCIFENCKNSELCSKFYPSNSKKFFEYVIDELLKSIPQSSRKKLIRGKCLRRQGDLSKIDSTYSLDKYYVQLINDSIYLINAGKCAYVFSLEQIIDIIKLERNIIIKYLPDSQSFELKKKEDKE